MPSFYRRYRDAQLAERAILLGARLPVLEHQLCLGKRALGDMYRHLVGATSNKGELPGSIEWFLRGVHHPQASLFAHLYRRERVQQPRSLALFIDTYAAYRNVVAAVPTGALSFDRAWFCARLLDSKVLVFSRCTGCRLPFLNRAYELDRYYRCRVCHRPARMLDCNRAAMAQVHGLLMALAAAA